MGRKDYPHRVEALLYRDLPEGAYQQRREFQSAGFFYGKIEAKTASRFDGGIAVDAPSFPRTHTLKLKMPRQFPDRAVAFRRDGVLYFSTGVIVDPSNNVATFDLSIHGECDVEANTVPQQRPRPVREIFV